MIDPSVIEERIASARQRDDAVTAKLKEEIGRLAIFGWGDASIVQAFRTSSGMPESTMRPFVEDGSYAMQLWSAICFAIDARAELKLLELIASPTFYSALMRSAAEVETKDDQS